MTNKTLPIDMFEIWTNYKYVIRDGQQKNQYPAVIVVTIRQKYFESEIRIIQQGKSGFDCFYL